MDPGESWELFDLDTELHVSISEDAKDYLRQFGLEEYNFENYQPTDDPGSYFKDVPRDQNPEALFDDLTRESIRRNSGRSTSWSARSSLTNGRAVSTKGSHMTSTTNRQTVPHSIKPSQTAPIQRPPPRVDSISKNGESPKSSAKRVSFTEQIENETTPHKQKEEVELNQKHAKTMTNFFGRPKIKSNKKSSQKQENVVPNTSSETADDQQQQQQQQPGKNRNIQDISGQKKGKKFKFPAFDMMRTRKSVNNPTTIYPKTDETDGNSTQRTSTDADDSSPSKTSIRSGIESLDLISNSPELPESSLPNKVNNLEIECDTDTIGRVSIGDQSAIIPRTMPERHDLKSSRGTNLKTNVVNSDIIETVSFQEEAAPQKIADGLDGILVGEQLHPALIAAAKGDLPLLKDCTRHLTAEGLLKIQDERGNTMLHTTAAVGSLPCLEYVCQRCPHLGTTENKAHHSPAAIAIKHGQIEVVDWLLENMNLRHELFPSTAKRRCLLHHAAKFGQDGCLRLLLSKLENIPNEFEFSDQHGNTPAHMAAKYGHILCLQTLVEYGFDVCSANQYQQTPCYYADFNNHRHCAGYLMVVETCTQLARHHVDQSKHIDWLTNRNEDISNFTTETLRLSSSIARQSAEEVDVTYRLQQTLDDAMDLVGDVTTQLKHLYEQNSSLRETNNNAIRVPGPGKAELETSLERAVDLQRRLESFDSVVNHQTSRQQILRVKEVQRRWEKLLKDDIVRGDRDRDILVKQLLRERFSDAVQRLLVYRTAQDNTKSLLANHHLTTSSPKHNSSPSFSDNDRPRHMDQPPDVSPTMLNKDKEILIRLSPRARVEGIRAQQSASDSPKSPHAPDSSPAATSAATKKDPSETSNGNINDSSFDRSSTGSSSSCNQNSPRCDKTRNNAEPKNNVVESFLKDRLFYQQEKESHGSKKVASAGLFYAGSVPSAPNSSNSSDSPRLKFSEFSAFNRVSNRTQGEASGDPNDMDSRYPVPEVSSSGVSRLISNKNQASPEKEMTKSPIEDQGSSHRIDTDEDASSASPANEAMLTIANLNRHNENENISHVKKIISHLEKRKEESAKVLPEILNEEQGVTDKTGGACEEIEPDTSSSEDNLQFINKVQNNNKLQLDPSSGNTWESETTSEEQSEDLSDLDLGPELQGDDLMLGPHGYLDDELEDGEEYADEIFSPEDLLALTPGGRLPLSMQFETSLSTIEEVSVVSESTRAGGETDTENIPPGSVDLDVTTDSEGTVTSDVDDDKPSLPGNKLKQDGVRQTNQPDGHPDFASSERPWYEMSDEEEGGPSTRLQIPRHQLKEHFTIF